MTTRKHPHDPTEGDPRNEKAGTADLALEAKIAELEAATAEAKDRHLRLAADFDNYKKRVDRMISDRSDAGRRDLLKRILDVLDSLDRAAAFRQQGTPPEQLVDGIRAVAAGDTLLAPSVTRRLIQEYVRRPPDTLRTSPPELARLTAREVEVLQMMARGRSNTEIATDLFVSETTVKTHVAHVLAKLGVRDRVQAVVFAYEAGMVLPGDSG